ncbi:PREDICTED: uncharacterized protein LOC109126467 [Camelina sativa]|uniref:Uncharacterized protein LOC109126467 n=1 Tax=Camelina sativa TaxID=90675 RepID=A0ABM1QFN6_CAMSA|nr:PREDICTED: uncharacterized protein LOC109126467 [Camelina sativa]
MDVHNAFLHGDLREEFYMKLPPGFSAAHPNKSLSDYSLFTLVRGAVRINILIYVDDFIISGSSPKATQDFKDYLASCFHMKDLGPLKYFLGIGVARNSKGIYICQRKYALDIISETDLAFYVHMLARFMQQPRTNHWEAALRLVRYLKSDPGQGVLRRSTGDFQITGWCDSDYATCSLTRRSVTGYIVQLGDSPIS